MRARQGDSSKQSPASEPIPFPPESEKDTKGIRDRTAGFDLACLPESAEQVFDAIDDMSRRIDDLARELRCLGHFDDGDGPRAA